MEAANDRQLLQDFAERGSEAAFRTLAERHLRLVQTAALRQLNDHHLAEEVTQAVFILLAQKAASLPRGIVVAGWLHRTTHFVAQRTRRAEGRRREREQKAFAMQDSSPATPEAAWADLAPVLDDALLRLGETDRHAVLLRFFEQRNHREIARTLGLGEEAAKKRIARALEKLRGFLGQMGVSISVVTLGTLLSEHGAQAAPADLAKPVIDPTLRLTPVSLTSTTVARLVSETLHAWRQTRLLRTASWALGGVATLAILWAAFLSNPLTRSPEIKTPVAQPLAEGIFGLVPPPPETASMNTTLPATQNTSEREMLLVVVDAATGQGIPAAQVQVQAMSWATLIKEPSSLRTDSNGVALVRFETNTQHLVVGALVPGRTPRCVRFDPHRGEIIPDQYTLRLPLTEQAIGGALLSPEGQPVADAELRITFRSGGDHSQREPDREYTGTASYLRTAIARSGPDGRWTSSLIPKDHPGFQITAHHPNHAPTTVIQASPGLAPSPQGSQLLAQNQQLWAGQLTTTLNRSLQLAGTVTDSRGHPIAQAELIHAPHSDQERTIRTSDDGRFRWENLNQGPFSFTVLAPGHSPRQIQGVVALDSAPVDVVLTPSAILRLRIVDPSGAGVEGAIAWPEQWEGAFYAGLNKSGPDGRIEWREAPANEAIRLYVAKFGWGERRDVSVVADGSEHEIILRPAPRIRGRVLDAESGRPIAEFKAIPSDRGAQWRRGDTQVCRNGDLQLAFMEGEPPYQFRIEAEGYLPFVYEPSESESFPTAPLEIRLRPAESAKAVQGLVLLPDGRPAAELSVDLLEDGSRTMLGRRSLLRRGGTTTTVKTDAQGRFRFPPEADGKWLVAAGESGFALAQTPALGESLTLPLQAWGRIEGRIDLVERHTPHQSVWLNPGPQMLLPELRSATSKAEPDSEGRFVFDSVRPGEYTASLRIADAPPGHHETWIAVEPGRTTQVRIADPGPRLRGRLIHQGTRNAPLNGREFAVTVAKPGLPHLNFGPLSKPPSPEEAEQRAAEVRRIQRLRSGIVAAFPDSEGRFVTPEGLAPGDYLLGIHRISSPSVATTVGGRPGRAPHHDVMIQQMMTHHQITSRPGIAEIPITVPAPPADAAPGAVHDLGDIVVPVPPQP